MSLNIQTLRAAVGDLENLKLSWIPAALSLALKLPVQRLWEGFRRSHGGAPVDDEESLHQKLGRELETLTLLRRRIVVFLDNLDEATPEQTHQAVEAAHFLTSRAEVCVVMAYEAATVEKRVRKWYAENVERLDSCSTSADEAATHTLNRIIPFDSGKFDAQRYFDAMRNRNVEIDAALSTPLVWLLVAVGGCVLTAITPVRLQLPTWFQVGAFGTYAALLYFCLREGLKRRTFPLPAARRLEETLAEVCSQFREPPASAAKAAGLLTQLRRQEGASLPAGQMAALLREYAHGEESGLSADHPARRAFLDAGLDRLFSGRARSTAA